MFTSLNSQHPLGSALEHHALKTLHNHLGSVSLFPENPLRLSAVATLLPTVAPLSLGTERLGPSYTESLGGILLTTLLISSGRS